MKPSRACLDRFGEVVQKVEERQARRLIVKQTSVLWDVQKSVRDILRSMCGQEPSDVFVNAVVEAASLHPVGYGLFVLIPRPSRELDGVLEKVRQAVELWKHAYDYYDEGFHRLVAALLYNALAKEDELYNEDARGWYYYTLVEKYPGIVSEVRYDRKGVLIRVGGTWIRRTVVYCGNRECSGFMLFNPQAQS